MVAGDQDQGLIGVLLGEVDGHLYRIGQGLRVVDGGGGVVGVAGPVDLAASHVIKKPSLSWESTSIPFST